MQRALFDFKKKNNVTVRENFDGTISIDSPRKSYTIGRGGGVWETNRKTGKQTYVGAESGFKRGSVVRTGMALIGR